MKKILLGFMVLGVSFVFAGNSAKVFDNKKTQTGGLIDDEVIFIYPNKKNIENITSDSALIMMNIAKEEICKAKDTRSIIVKAGMSVKYIYIGDKKTVIVKINDCKGVDLAK